MLLMKKTYVSAIRSGTKRTVFRRRRSRCIRLGSVHRAPERGGVRIDDVRSVKSADLTDDDAWADGIEGLTRLERALRRMYPSGAGAGRKLYQLHFTLLPPDR